MEEEFLPIVVHYGPSRLSSYDSDARRWAFSSASSVRIPHSAPVTNVVFSPLLPHDVAVSSGPSVVLIDPRTATIRRSITRFRDIAHSPSFKSDGRLLVAGCEDGTVQLFDLASRSVLRNFNGHKGAVHSSLFSLDGLRVMSGSDDCVVRGWDLPTAQLLFSLRDATDYVRAQAPSPASKHLWAAGSYDRRARIYDLRTQETLFTLDHGAQIDDIVLLPGGARAVTVGGTDIRVWDLYAGGKVVANLQYHAKAVTCCAVSTEGDMLFSGGLDGYVKALHLSKLEVISSMSCNGQVLSLDLSPPGRVLAVGLADGTVEFFAHKRSVAAGKAGANDVRADLASSFKEGTFQGWGRGFEKPRSKTGPNPGSIKYLFRGMDASSTDQRDLIITKRRRTKLEAYDKLLRRFSYGEALDLVLTGRKPQTKVVHGLFVELSLRNGLRIALAGRNSSTLVPVLSFINRNIRRPQYLHLLVHIVTVILEMYGDLAGGGDEVAASRNETFDGLLANILHNVKAEISLTQELCNLHGLLSVVGTSCPPGP